MKKLDIPKELVSQLKTQSDVEDLIGGIYKQLVEQMLQTDGITYFDCMDFRAFNESTRLKISVLKHKQYFGACYQLGADNIHPTNANRRYLTEKQIFGSRSAPTRHDP